MNYDITLLDDGTMDTVIEVSHPRWGDESQTFRYSDTSEYRDPETGYLDEDAFFEEVVIPDAEMEE